ncbi:MAG: hypothetical protein SOY73_04575 [Blautia sp.]|nr:hypothetical protein [Blautia sp.]MDY3998366.1 hypothetical protein [Blautia sp.]
MSTDLKMRRLKFWFKNSLEIFGISVGMAVFWMLFMAAGNREFTGSIVSMGWQLFPLFPYYLMLAGFFMTAITGVSYFQAVFSVLISMGATRKQSICGIYFSTGGAILGILAAAGLIWKLIPGDISVSGWQLMPAFTGVLFSAAALFLIIGAVLARWGKIGLILLGVVYLIVGGFAGATFVLSNGSAVMKILSVHLDKSIIIAAFVGIVLYLATGIFILRVTRKLEVHT